MESEELQAARAQRAQHGQGRLDSAAGDAVRSLFKTASEQGEVQQEATTDNIVTVQNNAAAPTDNIVAHDSLLLTNHDASLRLQHENALLKQQLAEAHVRISEVAAEALAAATPLKLTPGAAPPTCGTCKGALGDAGAPSCAACGAPHEPVCERCGLSANLPTELNKARLLLTATRAALESVARLKTEVRFFLRIWACIL